MTAINTTQVLQKFHISPEEMSGEVRNGIGLVVPFDFALDDEYYKWLPSEVPMFVTRTPQLLDPNVTVDLAKEVSSELAVVPAVSSLLAVQPAAIGYACTSGSFVNGLAGERHLHEVMLKAGAKAAVTTSGALAEAIKTLGIKRLAVVTPYNAELTELLVDYLAQVGAQVTSAGYFDMERDIARIEEDAVERIAHTVDSIDAEAIFFSCTNLHTFEIIERLERQLKKPILSANQVTAWSTLKAGNLSMPDCNQKLFQCSN